MQKETDQVSCWYELAAEIIIQACDAWRNDRNKAATADVPWEQSEIESTIGG